MEIDFKGSDYLQTIEFIDSKKVKEIAHHAFQRIPLQ